MVRKTLLTCGVSIAMKPAKCYAANTHLLRS